MTELSIIITELLKTGAFNAVIIDSLPPFLVHVNAVSLERFMLYIISKLRNINILCVMIWTKDGDKKFIRTIEPACDEIIDF